MRAGCATPVRSRRSPSTWCRSTAGTRCTQGSASPTSDVAGGSSAEPAEVPRVQRGEELGHCLGGPLGADRAEDVEGVLGEGQFGEHHRLVAHGAQGTDETARLLDRYVGVVSTVHDEEGRPLRTAGAGGGGELKRPGFAAHPGRDNFGRKERAEKVVRGAA